MFFSSKRPAGFYGTAYFCWLRRRAAPVPACEFLPPENVGLDAANNRSPIIQVMQAEGKGALLPVAGVLGTQRD